MRRRIKNKQGLVFAFLVAGLAITLCSRSSVLAPFNNWDDANSYFSMGKALFNGKVIYRDILDQKGPFLYFFYGIAYLISNRDFFGVYLMEIVFAGAFLYGALRILRLTLGRAVSCALLPVLGALIYSSVSFWWGGSAEELCLPFLCWPLYFLLSHFAQAEKGEVKAVSPRDVALTGLFAGVVALIKFNSLGFFAAWMLSAVILRLRRKEGKEAVRDCLWFLLWMLLPFLPWFLYFGFHQALDSWYRGYIYFNVFVYADFTRQALSVGERAYKLAKILYWLIREHIQYFSFILLGGLAWMLSPKKDWAEKLAVFAMGFFLFLGIYIGGVELKYYSLPLSVFAVLGFAVIGGPIERLIRKGRGRTRPVLSAVALTAAGFLLAVALMNGLSLNTQYRGTDKEGLYVYCLADCMEVDETTTLLNIGCFDIGLYTVTGIVPNCYWFQTQTLPIEDVLLEQEQYIREGRIDYVVSRESYPAWLEEGYQLIAEEKEEARDFTYYLFERKDRIE